MANKAKKKCYGAKNRPTAIPFLPLYGLMYEYITRTHAYAHTYTVM